MPDNVCQHIQAPAVRHSHCDRFNTELSGAFNQLIEQRNYRFASFNGKTLLAEILRIQKTLELLRGNQFPKDSLLHLGIDWFGMNELAANLLAQPELFFLALNVPVFGADFAAIRAQEDVEDLAQRRCFCSGQSARNEQPIEIPNRQAICLNVQFGMIKQRHCMQWIDVGDQVAAHSVSIDQFHHPRLPDRLLVHLIRAQEQRISIDVPAQRRMRNSQVRKNLVVKLIFPKQQFVHPGEKCARFSTLNNAVIVSAADSQRFADPKLRQNLRRDRLVLGRIFNGARSDDHRLAAHQTWCRSHGTEGAGISQGDCRALEVRDLQLAFARARDDVIVGFQEIRETKLIRILDVGNEQ